MEPEPIASPPARSVLDWPGEAGVTAEVLRELDLRRTRRHRRRRALGGAVAAALVGVLAWRGFAPPAPIAPSTSPTAVALPARQMLSDGSIVELKEGAEISVEFSDAQRRVVLRRGTAHFQVAKNAARPFVVDVAGFEVRAVGTAFSVQLGARQVEVLVTEGRVAVDHPVDTDLTAAVVEPLAVMDAGDSFVLDLATQDAPVPPVQPVPAAELDERLAWRAPKLEFSGTRLAEAIPMFNRHSRRQLVLADPALGELRLSGILRADNTTALLHLLRTDFDITGENRGDGEIVLKVFTGQKPK